MESYLSKELRHEAREKVVLVRVLSYIKSRRARAPLNSERQRQPPQTSKQRHAACRTCRAALIGQPAAWNSSNNNNKVGALLATLSSAAKLRQSA